MWEVRVRWAPDRHGVMRRYPSLFNTRHARPALSTSDDEDVDMRKFAALAQVLNQLEGAAERSAQALEPPSDGNVGGSIPPSSVPGCGQ